MNFPYNVQPLKTPVSPPEKGIEVWGHTVDAYGPLFWNMMYLGHRYLENIDDETLLVRYRSIVPGGHLKTGQLWPGQNRPAAGRFLVNHFLYF